MINSTYPKHPEQDERDEFDEVPGVVILDVEHHQVVVAKGVEGSQHEGCGEGAEERSPQGLQGEVVTHLQAEVSSYIDSPTGKFL